MRLKSHVFENRTVVGRQPGTLAGNMKVCARPATMVLAILTATTGCSGSSASVPSVAITVNPTPSVISPSPVAVASFPASIPFSSGALSGNVLVPSAANAGSGASVTVIATSVAPGGITPLLAVGKPLASTPSTSLIFVAVTSNETITLTGLPGLELALTGLDPTKGPFYASLWNPTPSPGAWQSTGTVGVIGNGDVIFPATMTPMTLVANQTYVFELYQLTGASGRVVASPSSLSFLGVAPSDAKVVGLSELGYSGTFAIATTCATVATITPLGNQFVVIPIGAGTCAATFSDSAGNSAALPIVVTTTVGGGQ